MCTVKQAYQQRRTRQAAQGDEDDVIMYVEQLHTAVVVIC